jgi:hypothetical protein
MPKFRVTTILAFSGTFTVKADNQEQAREKIMKHCGLVIGNMHTTLPTDDIDWDFSTHCEKEIISIHKEK